MIQLDIDQSVLEEDIRISEETLEAIQKEVQQKLPDEKGVIAVSFVSDQEIQRLNRMYREKDTVTDVLSFAYPSSDSEFDYIGDIAISIEQAKRQATNDDVELEIIDLLVHGILHVLGFDHETPEDAQEMFPLQDHIVQTVL